MFNRRLIPPPSGSSVTVNGRTYSAAAAFSDVPQCDADILTASGWAAIADSVGATSTRPSAGTSGAFNAVVTGWKHWDSTLTKMVIWAPDGTWRDPSNGTAV